MHGFNLLNVICWPEWVCKFALKGCVGAPCAVLGVTSKPSGYRIMRLDEEEG